MPECRKLLIMTLLYSNAIRVVKIVSYWMLKRLRHHDETFFPSMNVDHLSHIEHRGRDAVCGSFDLAKLHLQIIYVAGHEHLFGLV